MTIVIDGYGNETYIENPKGTDMILEVGAGGCIMVTPPAKGSRLDRELTGAEEVVQVIDGGPEGTIYIGDALRKGEATLSLEYERHIRHVYDRDEDGRVKVVPNPDDPFTLKLVILHKKGDLILDEDGNPIVLGTDEYRRYEKQFHDEELGCTFEAGELMLSSTGKPLKPFNWRNAVPHIKFEGIRDGETRMRCSSPHLSELKYLTDEGLAEFIDAVMKETTERVGGKSYYCWRCDTRTVYHNGELRCSCAKESTAV